MKNRLLALIFVLAMTRFACAVAVVRLSVDGINPAPETVDVLAGELFEMYVTSDTDGEGYWRALITDKSNPVTISNVQTYPAAGSGAGVRDSSDSLEYWFRLGVSSSDDVIAGKHFGFDVAIAPDAIPGTVIPVQIISFAEGDDVYLNVIPESAMTYYVDAVEGSDDNDGLSKETPFATIQKAIDSAYDGDTVEVQPGTYTGPGNRDIDFLGKAITVRSESGPENCIIDCQNSGRGFYFHNGEDANSVLDGLTITSGNALSGGGGIYCYRSSPTINNCIISDNSAGYGGGIYCEQSSPTITNCTINGNSARHGGGILCVESSPTINNCNIIGNKAGSNWEYGYGGGIYCYRSNPIISNCIITGNSSDDAGGGIDCWESNPAIINCTIVGNTAPRGGGIYIDNRSISTTITNCILWDNSPQQIRGNPSVAYSDIQGSWPGEGNIDEDPYFVEPGYWADANDPNIIVEPNHPNAVWVNGDYHLLRTSPCVDAANDANVYTDIEGNIRPFDFPGVDNNGELPEFDMGAYELVPVEAAMKLTPQMLNCNSRGKYVKAHLTLPEEFLPQDVDVNESAIAEPMGIESEYINILGNKDGPVRLEVTFDREAFCDVLTDTDDSLEITVIGSLTTSRYFYATDTIRIKPRR